MSWKEDYDWKYAFEVAMRDSVLAVQGATCSANPFDIGDVASVFAMENGENDASNWLMVGVLSDGRFFYISSGCDYTGWG